MAGGSNINMSVNDDTLQQMQTYWCRYQPAIHQIGLFISAFSGNIFFFKASSKGRIGSMNIEFR